MIISVKLAITKDVFTQMIKDKNLSVGRLLITLPNITLKFHDVKKNSKKKFSKVI